MRVALVVSSVALLLVGNSVFGLPIPTLGNLAERDVTTIVEQILVERGIATANNNAFLTRRGPPQVASSPALSHSTTSSPGTPGPPTVIRASSGGASGAATPVAPQSQLNLLAVNAALERHLKGQRASGKSRTSQPPLPGAGSFSPGHGSPRAHQGPTST